MPHLPQDPQPRRAAQEMRPTEKDRRDSDEQSGSTGRNTGTGDHRDDGKDSGQDRYGMTGGDDRNPPQPGQEAGSSGTSEYGGSDYGEPGDHKPRSPAKPESTKSSGSASPPRDPSKQRQLRKG